MAITNSGVSPKFVIGAEPISAKNYQTVKAVNITEAKPPVLNSNNSFSLAITKWTNPFPEFMFDAISTAKYDGVAMYLGVPSNQPDVIKDYHYIGLLRGIDYYLAPTYSGSIYMECDGTPRAGSSPGSGDKP